MADIKTPGVYVKEIASLPGSVVGGATAIPAFIGYTEKFDAGGDPKAIKVNNLAEYETLFGKCPDEEMAVKLSYNQNKLAVDSVEIKSENKKLSLIMYYNIYQKQEIREFE